jgi:hypothetical protein
VYDQSQHRVSHAQLVKLKSSAQRRWCYRSYKYYFTKSFLSFTDVLSHINPRHYIKCRRDSDWLRAGRPRGRSSSPDRLKNFLFSMTSRPALGSTQPPIQWVPGALSSGVKRPGVKLTTHLQLVPGQEWRSYTSTPSYAFMA